MVGRAPKTFCSLWRTNIPAQAELGQGMLEINTYGLGHPPESITKDRDRAGRINSSRLEGSHGRIRI